MPLPPRSFPAAGRSRSPGGFTLVETVLALGIAVFFLAGIFTVLSAGLSTSKEASDDTAIGSILRETAARMRGQELLAAPRTFYFDNLGRPVEQTADDARNNAYCAVATASAPASPPPGTDLRALVIKVYSHVAETPNAPAPGTPPAATFSLPVSSASGNGWKRLDPAYHPKIDF